MCRMPATVGMRGTHQAVAARALVLVGAVQDLLLREAAQGVPHRRRLLAQLQADIQEGFEGVRLAAAGEALDLRAELAAEKLVHERGVRQRGRRLLARQRALVHGVNEVAAQLVRILLPPKPKLPRQPWQRARDGRRRVHARRGSQRPPHVGRHQPQRVKLLRLGARAPLRLQRAVQRRVRQRRRVRQALQHAVQEARVAQVGEPCRCAPPPATRNVQDTRRAQTKTCQHAPRPTSSQGQALASRAPRPGRGVSSQARV